MTHVLEAWRRGEAGALERLLPHVYQELKGIARRQLARSKGARSTLDTTALVHEAYLKLANQARLSLRDRAHFLGVAGRAMRQLLVDRARRRLAEKRGGSQPTVALGGRELPVESQSEAILALEEALERLAATHERSVRVVECRFFVGLTEEETAEALDVSVRTVQRDLILARDRLRRDLAPEIVERLSG
jgi:RNA polymerase sigma factor (TIGR02999 family)